MDSKALARSFIQCFCNADLAGLEALLPPRFRLSGPLFEFDSRAAWLDSLKGNLVADPGAEILAMAGGDDEIAAFFTYHGNTIAQLFRCDGGKIVETILVFDTARVG